MSGDEPAFGVIIFTNNQPPVEIQPVADGNIRIIGNIHDKSDEKQDDMHCSCTPMGLQGLTFGQKQNTYSDIGPIHII